MRSQGREQRVRKEAVLGQSLGRNPAFNHKIENTEPAKG